MKLTKVASALAALTVAGVAWASPASAASDTVYGNPAAGIADWHLQHGGDCMEMAAETIIEEETGVTLSEARINAYAIKERIASAVDGGLADGSYLVDDPELLAHYGVKATEGSHSITTVEADLKAGDRITAYVDAGTIWNANPVAEAAAGYAVPQADDGTADHVLDVDSIDATAGTVTLTDSGVKYGADEVVSLAVFKKAWAAGDYLTIVATGTTGKKA